MTQPELSIVIPLLNERPQLPELWADLRRQQQVDFELLIVDGGSGDGTLAWLAEQFAEGSLPGSVLNCAAGRGRQLNVGGRQAGADWLLFLHADSRFVDPLALRHALDVLQQTGSRQSAGHFSLRFRDTGDEPSLGYYYYQWKARLGRPETIHGDQGFLLRRDFYLALGGFREDLPVMEDTDFAERLRQFGSWTLLPMEISTSARRFVQEGLWQRQLLNSLMMCFRTIGFKEFFAAAPDVYRQQAESDNLRVRPFFLLIQRLFAGLGRQAAWKIWRQAGAYVRTHAWQLVFALDARRAYRRRLPIGCGQTPLTSAFVPVFDLLTDNVLGRLAATLLLRCWFVATGRWLKRRESG